MSEKIIISSRELQYEFNRILNGISSAAIEITKKAVDQTAKETNQVIKKKRKFKNRTGDYVKSFRIKTTQETKLFKEKEWYVDKPHYRLTHLLEDGHDIRNANGVKLGEAPPFPHVSKGAEYAEKRLEELIWEGLDDLL